MFGMLDYRAHKLYMFLFGIPWFVFRWMLIIGLPFLYYGIGHQVSDNRLLQIIASVVALFIIEIFVVIGVFYVDKFLMFIFNFLVDVIPCNDRTKEESLFVVKSGDDAIKLIELGKKHPGDWMDEDKALYHRGFFAKFFKDAISHRVEMTASYFANNPTIPFNESNIKDFHSKNNLSQPLFERLITNATYRAVFISYSIAILLLIFNPLK